MSPPTPPTPPIIERWLEFVGSGDPGRLDELLAEDAVFHSPAVFTPQRGRAVTKAYLSAAEKLFSGADFRYVGQWFAERSAVLQFTANLDGIHVDGVDMITWNDEDEIVEFTVMIRPFKAIQAVMPRMAELLQQPA